MSSLLLLVPAALAVVAFQATVVERLSLGGGHPDLILVGLLLLATQTGRQRAYPLAVLVAPLFDALAGLPLGVSVLPLLAVVYLAGLGERVLFGFRLGWPIAVTLLASVLAGLITLVELSLLGWAIPWTDILLRVLLPSTLLNALLMLALSLALSALGRRRLFDFT